MSSAPQRGSGELDTDTAAEVDLALSELIERMETISWSDVPEISTAEAAAWCVRFNNAREAVQEGNDVEQ